LSEFLQLASDTLLYRHFERLLKCHIVQSNDVVAVAALFARRGRRRRLLAWSRLDAPKLVVNGKRILACVERVKACPKPGDVEGK
jgi:hypothetical protein